MGMEMEMEMEMEIEMEMEMEMGIVPHFYNDYTLETIHWHRAQALVGSPCL